MAASDFATWLGQPAAQAVGWALVQFVWQGALVGALTALTLVALRTSAADVRYVVASIGLALMLTLPLVTGVQKYQALRATAAFDAAHGMTFQNGVVVEGDGTRILFDRIKVVDRDTAAHTAGAASAGPTASERLVALTPALLLLWICGVSILTLRLLTGWLWVQRLRRIGVDAADEMYREAASRLARRLHITRTVMLLRSSLVEVPTVVGFLKPVVLLPASALAGLTTQQIESILAHELAHIRRHDYLVNLLQTLVETVLFYHPAVWWLSRRIRIERENCCDDLAVSLCGDPVAYAAALADLESLRSAGPLPGRHIAMAATAGSLLRRVRRLLGAPASHSGRGPAWLAGSVALLLVGGIVVGADGLRQERSPVSQPAPAGLTMRTLAQASDMLREAAPSVAIPLTARARASVRAAVASVPTAGLPAFAPAAPAAPEVAPAPAAAPAAAVQSASISHQVNDSNGNWSWSNNGDHLEVSYSGTFEFTDDDTDVRQLSSGGWLKISDGKWLFGRHSVEIREHDGRLEHLYYVNATTRPYEPEGREWLRQNLPRFVRNTGIGADTRVARLLKSGGVAAVTAEIARIDTSYVKRIYYGQLFRQATLSPEQYRQALTQASREMASSSYEMAELLIGVAAQLPADEASRAAWFQAASVIRSDYDQRRVYSTMLKRGPVSAAILGGILSSARAIGSDYDLSELLRQILAQQTIDEGNRAAFFNAVATIGSDYEHHRVLSAMIAGDRATDAGLLHAALASASTLHSDYETSTFLQDVLRHNGVEGVRAPFFTAVDSIGSAYERGRVLQAVVRRADVSGDTLRAVLQSARAMNGYELSQLLQLVARSHAVSGDLRDAYMSAADRLGGYDQTQALAALARSESRK